MLHRCERVDSKDIKYVTVTLIDRFSLAYTFNSLFISNFEEFSNSVFEVIVLGHGYKQMKHKLIRVHLLVFRPEIYFYLL
jgi:hypothetical protein